MPVQRELYRHFAFSYINCEYIYITKIKRTIMLRRSMMNLSPPTLLELDSPAHRKVCGLFSFCRCRYGLADR
jgi:hypothetical protein